jgi:tRNA(Leu) C34 or U34 (ribose-2'-O)-methylase TrmL
MLSLETTNTNFIVFGLTRLGLENTIYHTRVGHTITIPMWLKWIQDIDSTQVIDSTHVTK